MFDALKDFDFSRCAVLVTGAAGTLGAGISRVFAAAGASLCLHYRTSRAQAEALAADLPHPERHRTVYADGSDEASVQAAVADCVDFFGTPGLRVLINNAGSYPSAALADIDAVSWRQVMDANLGAAHFFTRACLPHLAPGAAIVNIASIEALRPARFHAHYAAAKAALVQYTKSTALELGERGIRANAVLPGLIHREGLQAAWPTGYAAYVRAAPLGRVGQAEEVGAACLFLASRTAAWITGAALVVDGGASLSAPQDPSVSGTKLVEL